MTRLRPYWIYIIPILVVGIVAWYPVLDFWFLKAFEASWLHDALPYTFTRLVRTHSFLYWINLKLFGWDPRGWYGMAILMQLIASVVLFRFVVVLTKNKLLAMIAGLIFVANTAYNDVLTWGSFNSYYPLLLSFMLLALTSFVQYKETEKRTHLLWSLVWSILAFYTRETGIVVVALIVTYDLLTSGSLLKKDTWLGIIKRVWPFVVAVGLFLFLRSLYGGTIGDTVDSNVKMQIRLVQDKLYAEYARVTLLTFGKLIPPILVPYTILNEWRAVAMRTGDVGQLAINYFPQLGYIGYGLLGLLALAYFRHKKFFHLMLFFWLWIGIFSLFIALAIPLVHEVLIRDYEVITMRYRYFAFAGASILYAMALVGLADWLKGLKLPAAKTVAPVLLGLVMIGVVYYNVTELHKIEESIYQSTYKSAKEFQLQFQKEFPTLSTNAAFYIYPHAPGLNDNLFEWYLTKESKYPNLVGQPYRIESQLEAVTDKVSKGKLAVEDFYFLDYSPATGLINKTEEIRKIIASDATLPLNLNKQNDTSYTTPSFVGSVIELPQNFAAKIKASFTAAKAGPTPHSRFRALVDYSVAHKKYLDTVKLTSCRTISQRDEEPFYYYHPDHLVDGNMGRRSSWIADAVPAWVQAELPNEQEVMAVAWGSIEGSTRVPSSYTYAVSNDGQNWRDVKTVKNNTNWNPIDRFDAPVKAKYVKMTIDTTNSGDFVQLDEFEVLTTASKAALDLYKDRSPLLNDTYNIFNYMAGEDDLNYAKSRGLNFHWAKLSWGADQASHFSDTQYVYFPYSITGADSPVSVKIPEGEIYAAVGQLLTKHYTSVSVDLGGAPISSQITGAELVPRYKLK